jgi:di/tricarboxylate transporter
MLPISTPPNALAHSRGEFTSGEMARAAIIISLTAAVMIVLTGGLIMNFWGLLKG